MKSRSSCSNYQIISKQQIPQYIVFHWFWQIIGRGELSHPHGNHLRMKHNISRSFTYPHTILSHGTIHFLRAHSTIGRRTLSDCHLQIHNTMKKVLVNVTVKYEYRIYHPSSRHKTKPYAATLDVLDNLRSVSFNHFHSRLMQFPIRSTLHLSLSFMEWYQHVQQLVPRCTGST